MKIIWRYCLPLFTILAVVIKAQNAASDEKAVDVVPSTSEPLKYFISPRIVGGLNAAEGQFPHQISLRVRDRHLCGGSIISKNYIVTAAHCVRGISPSQLSIRAGTTFFNSGGVVIKVSQVISHPQYANFANDIALLKLTTALTFNNRTKSIPLATTEVPLGAPVVISGWGRVRGGGPTAVRLQYNILNAISTAECRRRIGNVPQSILCLAHLSGNGACQGDSGGPAVYNGVLVGVTNFVIGNCGTNAPDGYAKISYLINWLRQNSDL